jgi:hypothetical protein
VHLRLLIAALAFGASTARAQPIDQVVAAVDAIVTACGPLDPKLIRSAQELLVRARAQSKFDLAAIRKTEAYTAAYNAETNRLLLMPPKQRLASCQGAL